MCDKKNDTWWCMEKNSVGIMWEIKGNRLAIARFPIVNRANPNKYALSLTDYYSPFTARNFFFDLASINEVRYRRGSIYRILFCVETCACMHVQYVFPAASKLGLPLFSFLMSCISTNLVNQRGFHLWFSKFRSWTGTVIIVIRRSLNCVPETRLIDFVWPGTKFASFDLNF